MSSLAPTLHIYMLAHHKEKRHLPLSYVMSHVGSEDEDHHELLVCLLNILSLLSFSNNSIDVSLLEVCEKEVFEFDKLTSETTETDSNAGKVAADLQGQAYRIFQRKR